MYNSIVHVGWMAVLHYMTKSSISMPVISEVDCIIIIIIIIIIVRKVSHLRSVVPVSEVLCISYYTFWSAVVGLQLIY